VLNIFVGGKHSSLFWLSAIEQENEPINNIGTSFVTTKVKPLNNNLQTLSANQTQQVPILQKFLHPKS